MSAASIGCRSARFESREALFQLGRQERAHRRGADHLRHLHDLRHRRIARRTSRRPTRWSRATPNSRPPRPAYADAVSKLEPLLKEADDYYTQENYKDDKMAKGKALHPRLVAAWDAFASADKNLRTGLDTINDKRAGESLAEIEQKEGRKARYQVEALMIQAKRVMRAEGNAKARHRRDHAGTQ